MVYVIPGLILLTFFALYEQIILFEQERGVASLGKSFSMAKNAFFAIFTIVVFCLVVRYVPIYILQTIGDQLVSGPIFGIDQAIEIFINTITIAFVSSIYVTLYDEIKNYKPSKTIKNNKKNNNKKIIGK